MEGLDSLRSDSPNSLKTCALHRGSQSYHNGRSSSSISTHPLTNLNPSLTMILNCYTCGKSVSSKLNLCLYCKAEMASMETGPVVTPATQREKRKGLAAAFLSLVLG